MEKITFEQEDLKLQKLSLQEKKNLKEGDEIFFKDLNGNWAVDTIEEVDADLLWLKGSSDINLDEVEIYKQVFEDKFDVLSPDGFSIHFSDVYDTEEQAKKAIIEWCKRYETQGYYSSVRYGRIPISEIPNYCKIISVEI
jgi:hypothetical protein